MMKRQIPPTLRMTLIILLLIATFRIQAQPVESTLKIDAERQYQTIDGFGVNINPAWWLDGDYRNTDVIKPAIDLLIDSLGATLFRVVIEEMNWEAVNDDSDPDHFNWDYYNSVFSNTRFQGVWNTLRYLNRRGITDGLVISFMGAPPAAEPMAAPDPVKSWMGNTDFTIHPGMEDEFVESMAALLYYARNTAKINFRLVSPMNETDIVSSTKNAEHPAGIVEGPNLPDPVQFARVIRKLGQKLDRIGMGDVRFVTPDASGDKLFKSCFDEILKDPYLIRKIGSWGVHQYDHDASNYLDIIRNPANPVKSWWITETAGIRNLLGQLDDSASAHFFWDGYDCVYRHGTRNGYGSVPPNDWVFWEGEQGKPLLAYHTLDQSWTPRKPFYQFSQLYRFVRPGAIRIGAFSGDEDLAVFAYLNLDGRLVIFGRNNGKDPVAIRATMNGLPPLDRLHVYFTNDDFNLKKQSDVMVSQHAWNLNIPAGTIFTLTGLPAELKTGISRARPEPPGWYAGDIHVHRNCGEVTPVWPETGLEEMMGTNDLTVISLLADMGNGEVKYPVTDLIKVTGSDAVQSSAGRIVHWDAEWHFDPEGVTFEHKALGGHLVLLGLKEANQQWEESPYKILEWGRKQNAIMGFCHMQYLNDSIPGQLNCCLPIDYPVETALGTIDFLSEDVWQNDAAINAYYKILNCGFRPGLAAGTDFPCNNSAPLGSLLTYVQVKEGPLTYQKWIEGIKKGRTVVTTNGHVEFLDLKVNYSSGPGDEIQLGKKGKVNIQATWTSVPDQQGSVEIVCNGKVVVHREASSGPGNPFELNIDLPVGESSWVCARRMGQGGHRSHTAPVFISVGKKPIRASAEDAEYFVRWIENIMTRTDYNGPWSSYFTKDVETIRNRYREAAERYREIAREAAKVKHQVINVQ